MVPSTIAVLFLISSASIRREVAPMEVTTRMLGEHKKNKWYKSWAEKAKNLRKNF